MPRLPDLHQQYLQACQSLSQPENPFIACMLQEADKHDKIKWTKGITLKIAGNNRVVPVQRVTDEDLQALLAVLQNTIFITGLDLRYNVLTDDGAKHMAKFLQENSTLRYLNLMFNDIGTSGAELIVRALQLPIFGINFSLEYFPEPEIWEPTSEEQKFPNNQVCHPDWNAFDSTVGSLSQVLTQRYQLDTIILQRNETLLHLRMTGNKIGNKGGMYFASMLQINSVLEKLDLGDCDLGTQSLIAIATVLTRHESVKAINLNRPLLHSQAEETTVHIALMLKTNSSLVELHLRKHEMKKFGVERLCEALYENCSLRYLDLSCNKITRDDVKILADLLKRNQTLQILDLNSNRIEDIGAIYLSEALALCNRTLQALAVASNNISSKGLIALSDSMKTNMKLSYIYIWGNNFDEATCMAFSELIRSGRLKPRCTDVEPYEVDGHVHLAEVSHGLRKHYYWTPSWAKDKDKHANASLALGAVSEYLR